MDKNTARIFEINNRKAEIRSKLQSGEKVDVDAIKTELEALDAEMSEIESRSKLADTITINKNKKEGNNMENYGVESKEYRSAFLKKIQGKELNEVEKRAFDSVGASAAIPTQTADTFIAKMKQIAPMLNEITLLQVTGNVNFAVQGTNAPATIHTENAEGTVAGDTIVKVTLGAYEYMKLISISKTVSTMSIDAFEGWLVDILASDIARAIEDAIINGTGTNAPQGIAALTYDAAHSVTVSASSNLTYDNICDAMGNLEGAYIPNAKFLMNSKTLFKAVMKIKDDSKAPIVMRNPDGTYSVMGMPVLLSSYVADDDIYFGDFTKVVANLSQDVKVESSDIAGFNRNAIDYKATAMFDCKVADTSAFVKITKANA